MVNTLPEAIVPVLLAAIVIPTIVPQLREELITREPPPPLFEIVMTTAAALLNVLVAVPLIVKELRVIVGMLFHVAVAVPPMVTSSPAAGTVPPLQLDPVFQAPVAVVPTQVLIAAWLCITPKISKNKVRIKVLRTRFKFRKVKIVFIVVWFKFFYSCRVRLIIVLRLY
jgi:hypothetical protein